MTKFVLHGGFNKERGFIKDSFFQETLSGAANDTNILLVYFAEAEEKVELRMTQAKEQFNKNSGGLSLSFRVPTEDSFIEDCLWADSIFLAGGRTTKLMEVLRKYKDLDTVFSGKVIAGDSAGANALGHFFYSKSSKEVGEGLKILPFKIVVHYVDGSPNPLADIAPEFETLFLREYETVVKFY